MLQRTEAVSKKHFLPWEKLFLLTYFFIGTHPKNCLVAQASTFCFRSLRYEPIYSPFDIYVDYYCLTL